MGLYLDYNASTPIDESVLELMIDVYRNRYGNADSRTHIYGSKAKDIVSEAREQVARLLGVKKNEVIFTSGSTESNNLAILGLKEQGIRENRKHIITTAIEHKSVLRPMEKMMEAGFDVDFIYPRQNGRIDAEEVIKKVRNDTLLVSIMHVNNETGTIQPLSEIGRFLEETDTWFHVDASQSCGKLVEELQNLRYDLLSLSAHKMYGPQGIGALITRFKNEKKPKIQPLMYGGGQENGVRPGTLPVALIAGLGKACENCLKNYEVNTLGYKANQENLLRMLKDSGVKYMINGDVEFAIKNTLNISFTGVDSEAFMQQNQEYIGVSNGSACTTSYQYKPSYVLKAMGLNNERVDEAIRISWGKEAIDFTEFERALELVKSIQSY